MRPALLLLVLFVTATLPARSDAGDAPPQAVLLACDTVSTNPLQVRFEFGVINPENGRMFEYFHLGPNDGSHILSCSTTSPGATCYANSLGVFYYCGLVYPGGQRQSFVFVADQGAPCLAASFYDHTNEGTSEFLCFSCLGIATPADPTTWGKVKAYYR